MGIRRRDQAEQGANGHNPQMMRALGGESFFSMRGEA